MASSSECSNHDLISERYAALVRGYLFQNVGFAPPVSEYVDEVHNDAEDIRLNERIEVLQRRPRFLRIEELRIARFHLRSDQFAADKLIEELVLEPVAAVLVLFALLPEIRDIILDVPGEIYPLKIAFLAYGVAVGRIEK